MKNEFSSHNVVAPAGSNRIPMKKLPLGLQNLQEIIKGDYIYVDKTRYIYNLINNAKYYFLSRPRRFGKSLLLDTIGEVFSGEKELFKGLFIYDSDYNFEQHPVLRLDMSNIANKTSDTLERSLKETLLMRVDEEGLEITDDIPSDIFKKLIIALYKKYGQRVVILIDEYDKPILDHLSNEAIAEENRTVLRGFYGILKSMDPFLRFTFITGVSRFTKTSIFSELNNLFDITLTIEYSNICGITIEDFDKYFKEHIENIATLEEFSIYSNVRDEILRWYDGYSWDGRTRVINPFSLLSLFMQKRFSGFWYASGTPKFLMDLIKKRPGGYTGIKNSKMGEWALNTFDIQKIEVEPLLFQTGYLTIVKVLPAVGSPFYLLDIPNFEVGEAFNLHILAEFTESGATYAETAYRAINESLKTGDLQGMLKTMKGLFASIPYQIHISQEAYYHSIFYAIMNLLGFEPDAEVSVSGGRIDAVLELEDRVYIIELKYKDCEREAAPETKQKIFENALDEAMEQIKDRGYDKKYAVSGKTIYQVALAFLGRDDIEMRVEIGR